MEIKSCEEYVLNKLMETEKELEEAKAKIEGLRGELKYKQFIIDRIDRIVQSFGKVNLFSTGNKEFEVSIHSYDEDFFDEIMRRYPNLKITDYRNDNNTEVEGEV